MKKAPEGAFFERREELFLLTHAFDGLYEIALHARCEILVHNFLVSDTIDHRLRFLHLLLRSGLVASVHCFLHFLNGSAKLRAKRCVVGALFVVLTGTLFSLGGVCHVLQSV